tara:strand:- start:376 stop:684 length:309 start_codon:yes stop_codon:yes gene_type:complete
MGWIFFYNMSNKAIKANMTLTLQQELNTERPTGQYNGWANWTTWNCALWIQNDEGLYRIARSVDSYFDFIIEMQEFDMLKTPDGASWTMADYDEMSDLINEL